MGFSLLCLMRVCKSNILVWYLQEEIVLCVTQGCFEFCSVLSSFQVTFVIKSVSLEDLHHNIKSQFVWHAKLP